MTGLHVTVPVACWRKGLAREYLETEEIPPPATVYGFLLSLVGETDRHRHVGCRVTAGLIGKCATSVVLRTVWRVKRTPLGSTGNTRPDYQQLLTGAGVNQPFVSLVVWLDSSHEAEQQSTLETRVNAAMDPMQRQRIDRFGGLSFGESTHLVDSVSHLSKCSESLARVFLLSTSGRVTLPVWVDHVGSSGTRYVVGDLVDFSLVPPDPAQIPQIQPHPSAAAAH